MDWTIWVGTISTVAGISVTQGFNIMNQRRQLRTSRHIQFDKDIAKTTASIFALTAQLKPTSSRFWRLKEAYDRKRPTPMEDDPAVKELEDKLDDLMDQLAVLVAELKLLTASDRVKKAADKFFDDCEKRFREDYEVFDEDAPGGVQFYNKPDYSIKIDDSIAALTEAVQQEIGKKSA